MSRNSIPRLALRCLVTASILLIGGARAASTDVVIDNFDPGGGFHLSNYQLTASARRSPGGSGQAARAAVQFSVAGGDYSLDTITLPIGVKRTVPGDLLRIRLTTDVGSAPGTTLEVLSENQAWPSTDSTTTTTLVSAAHPLLLEGQSYWIVAELTALPPGVSYQVDYGWFTNTSGTNLGFRQQARGGALPVDPWTGTLETRPLAVRIEGTALHATYTWRVSSGDWTTPTNWAPTRATPATDDLLVFDGTVTPSAFVTDIPRVQAIGQLRVTGGAQVTFNALDIDSLFIVGLAGDDLVVDAGAKLALLAAAGSGNAARIVLGAGATGRVSGEITVDIGAHRVVPTDAGSLVFESGSHCRALSGFFGNLFDNTGTNGVVVFRSGSTYHQGGGSNAFGTTAPNSRIVLETGSLYRHTFGVGGAFGGRIYGDCEIDFNPATGGYAGGFGTVTMDNLRIISGVLRASVSSTTLQIKGDLTVFPAGRLELIVPNTGAVIRFIGASIQTFTPNGTVILGDYSNLEVANPTGVQLARYLFTSGTVTLSGGPIVTGPHLLHLGHTGTVVGPQWVVGNLGRILPSSASTVSRTWEVGDASRATPVTIDFASVGDTGTVVVRTDPGDHADLGASGLDPARSVNRSWTVSNLGMTFTTCDATLAFDPADVDAGADPAQFAVGKRDGSTWSLPSVGTRTATTTQATGLTSFSDFVVAEAAGNVGVGPPVLSSTTLLAPGRPSPFTSSTTLEFTLSRDGDVELAIYDAHGRRTRTLERAWHHAGTYRGVWDGRDDVRQAVAPGVYWARLVTAETRLHRMLIKLR